jgi:hypothetical protein
VVRRARRLYRHGDHLSSGPLPARCTFVREGRASSCATRIRPQGARSAALSAEAGGQAYQGRSSVAHIDGWGACSAGALPPIHPPAPCPCDSCPLRARCCRPESGPMRSTGSCAVTTPPPRNSRRPSSGATRAARRAPAAASAQAGPALPHRRTPPGPACRSAREPYRGGDFPRCGPVPVPGACVRLRQRSRRPRPSPHPASRRHRRTADQHDHPHSSRPAHSVGVRRPRWQAAAPGGRAAAAGALYDGVTRCRLSLWPRGG